MARGDMKPRKELIFYGAITASSGASQVALVVKNPPANAGYPRRGFDSWVGRSPGDEQSNPLHYSCLENPMDRGAWRAMVHRIAKSQTGLKRLSTAHSIFVC